MVDTLEEIQESDFVLPLVLLPAVARSLRGYGQLPKVTLAQQTPGDGVDLRPVDGPRVRSTQPLLERLVPAGALVIGQLRIATLKPGGCRKRFHRQQVPATADREAILRLIHLDRPGELGFFPGALPASPRGFPQQPCSRTH